MGYLQQHQLSVRKERPRRRVRSMLLEEPPVLRDQPQPCGPRRWHIYILAAMICCFPAVAYGGAASIPDTLAALQGVMHGLEHLIAQGFPPNIMLGNPSTEAGTCPTGGFLACCGQHGLQKTCLDYVMLPNASPFCQEYLSDSWLRQLAGNTISVPVIGCILGIVLGNVTLGSPGGVAGSSSTLNWIGQRCIVQGCGLRVVRTTSGKR